MERTRLPSRRENVHYEVVIKARKTGSRLRAVLTVSFYPSGSPGEIFLETMKTGSEFRTACCVWAITASVALQCGLPIGNLTKCLSGMKDDFGGVFTVPQVESLSKPTECESLWDALAIILRTEFPEEAK